MFGRLLPPNGVKGFWFYTGLLGLVLGSRLDTPFFAKPADVILYAAPAAVALALSNNWAGWDSGRRVAFVIALAYFGLVGLIGGIAIWTKDATEASHRRVSNAARVLGETLGAPRPIYTVLMIFALYAFHSDSALELGILALAWVVTAALSPLEASIKLSDKVSQIMRGSSPPGEVGVVAAYQTPGVILVRQTASSAIVAGDVLGITDPLGVPRVVIALDQVGRDEGLLLRTIEAPGVTVPAQLLSGVAANGCFRLPTSGLATTPFLQAKDSLVGLVAPDTSIERLFFEVVRAADLEEGRLVEVPLGDRAVTYQLVNGLTREEVVQQKNTFGFVRAQAQKIGQWEPATHRFRSVSWLPQPNAPVILMSAAQFQTRADAVGHFPRTDYPVRLREEGGRPIGLNALVTHNTAILGILGIGKSFLALELVERMMANGTKVLCLDLTNQYASELTPYHDDADNTVRIQQLQQVGVAGKTNVKQNVGDGGSRATFAAAVKQHISEFVASANRLLVFNPAQFEVWKQDSKPFSGTASMAPLTPPEITQIISDAALQVVSSFGMTEDARLCIVYEEAHSLVPEWNSAVGDGDRAAANGTARAILQGRKYGMGCLLITQRTANVTKTILNQCNSVFAMRTFDDTGKEFLANYLGRSYADVLPNLSERHAIFFGRASQCENPVLMRANDRAAFVQAFRAAHPPAAPGNNVAAAPIA